MSKKIYRRNCIWCGDPFDTYQICKTVCSDCMAAKKREEAERKKAPTVDKLGDLQREIDAYNREHGTALSYGQYVSKFGR